MKKEVIFVGWINTGKPADCGETMKNQLCISKLEEFGVRCRQVDFKNWKKHPWVLLQLLGDMLLHRDNTLILSTSAKNVYPLMKLMKRLKWKQNTVHWVIGGTLGQKVQQGIYKADTVGFIKHTLVESSIMVEQLEACGVHGVKEVPNFKPIPYYPQVKERFPKTRKPLRFVFLSRIMPEKGCDYILEAARMLVEEGYGDKFMIDFYGKVAERYQDTFCNRIKSLANVDYHGFLDLTKNEGYDRLGSYDLMLFPTYWRGEGFAGVFIDAFIAGLPIIASDWAHNRVFLKEGETALFIPVHHVEALKDKMKACIDGQYDLCKMAISCQKEAEKYHINNVVTTKLLSEIGVL